MLKNLMHMSKQCSCIYELHPMFKSYLRSFAHNSRDFISHKVFVKPTRERFEFSIFKNPFSTLVTSENHQNENVSELSKDHRLSKAFVSMRYSRLIKSAVREKGPHLELNPKLADVIKDAQRHQVPMNRIEASIGQAIDLTSHSGIIELSIPKICSMIIEYESKEPLKPSCDIHKICEKYPYAIFGLNLSNRFFFQKGVLRTSVQQNNQLSITSAENILSDIGAQSVRHIHNESGEQVFEFQCDPSHLHQVKNSLKNTDYIIEEAYVGYIAISTVKLSDKGKEAVHNMMSDIGELPDVNRIYHDLELE